MNIYVGNLPYRTTDDDLRLLFEQYGPVHSAKVIMDRDSGRSRGFGFVEMPTESEARKAIEELSDKEFQGRNLTVNEAKPREPRREGGYSAGGGQGNPSGSSSGYRGR
ncbi:MAG: RNA-binding protein [Phycisphaeraceae bacterium]|nr:RNA-binding protein [Phycisphaeraceae bacterium]